ncbi:unnamed protein product [Meloidogyne enterolobii]|uniref:Uncharacterized protein n=1 Tax=Meloidogyne enterolobii TaxID=390850 RepID=A0ACB0Z6Y7_MELEN
MLLFCVVLSRVFIDIILLPSLPLLPIFFLICLNNTLTIIFFYFLIVGTKCPLNCYFSTVFSFF